MPRIKTLANVFSAVLTVCFVIALETAAPSLKPVLFDVPLIFVFVCAFFFSFWQLLVVVLSSAVIVNWHPGVSAELVAFVLVPLVLWAVARLVPLRLFFAAVVLCMAGVAVFYGVIEGEALLSHAAFFARVLIVDVLWAGTLWYFFGALYSENYSYKTAGAPQY